MMASDAASDANAGSKLVSAIDIATRSVFAGSAPEAGSAKTTVNASANARASQRDDRSGCANTGADRSIAIARLGRARSVTGASMEMKRMSGGSLRAAGYDERARKLVVELTSGTFEYTGVPGEVWRRFSTASSPWSYFRDNIEEEYTARRTR